MRSTKRQQLLRLALGAAALLSSLAVARPALADQAEQLTKAQADKATALLGTQKQVKHHCAPCPDKGVYTETIEKVSTLPSERKGAWHVFIREEGEALDLAYVYFKDGAGRWKNIALHLGIKVEGVPLFLTKEAAAVYKRATLLAPGSAH